MSFPQEVAAANRRLGILVGGLMACLASGMALAAPAFIEKPSVRPNTNERAPLVALLSLEASEPSRAIVEVVGPARSWRVEFPKAASGKRELPIIGLRANTAHRMRVQLVDARDAAGAWSDWVEFHTPSLPLTDHGFPPIRVTKADTRRMEPGYTLLSVRRASQGRSPWRTFAQRNFMRAWGAIVILDPEGQVVWYYLGDSRFAGVKQLANGNILANRADSTTTELDLQGNILRQWYPAKAPPRKDGVLAGSRRADAVAIEGAEALHHQPFQLPNGNFLTYAAESQRIPNYYTSETDAGAPRKEQLVIGDRILEFDSRGRVVWSWSTFDHLDPFRIGYELTASYWQTRGFPEALDWTHANGLSYDDKNGLVIASFRHQDATIAIEHKSGKIRWILGEPTDWGPLADKVLKPVGPIRWPYHSHNPRFTGAGTLIMFDNGTWGARPFRKPMDPSEHFSRSVEFEIDQKAMTVRQVWASADKLDEDSCSAIAMGDAWRLPQTDNILEVAALCLRNRPGMTWNDKDESRPSPEDQAQNGARIREYTRTATPEVLFEAVVRDPSDIVSWMVYGGQRIKSLYPKDGAVVTQ
jgi:hypothetical protein